ncbi:response regulator containing a -like receiver domain protein and an hth dna-binding domain protein [Leptolyngbya sp. Heron Island J]|uniref:response regulator transcription factor n=1 Tax=Leptolyngbya sp. Heron Island J TaxID=1385935 RepID=UPI0003B95805|nr:response regulator transcription factor [Leptolyngbya sp. Heron Island J]ESA37780.1 response regulator containing a -like receiver domain protein and an hth dna-binding domain protein [Leptolyngbya sp. Heron Island J]
MIRLLLADDQNIFREGLATLLSVENDLEVIGQAENGKEAIFLAETLQPNVILMDVRMPVVDGVQATAEIYKRYPWIRILVLTTFDDDEYILKSLQAGALGYLLKRTPSQAIAAAIRSVAQGYSQLSPTVALKAFSYLQPVPQSSTSHFEKLSKREMEVLKLVGQGMNNQEISKVLHLSEGTIKNYVTQVLSKLEMRDRIQAALWAQKYLT